MTELKDIELNEVSLVTEGANPQAYVTLFKKKSESDSQTKSKPEPDAVTVDKSQIAKLAQTMNEVTKKLNEHIEKAQTAELTKIAQRYEILGLDTAELVQMLKVAKSTDENLYSTAIKTFDQALESVKKAGTFEELGKSGNSSGTSNQIGKIAQSIRKNNPELNFRQALDKAYLEHPELQD